MGETATDLRLGSPRRTHAPESVRVGALGVERSVELAADLAARLTREALQALARSRVVAAPLKGVLLLARWPELRGRRDLADVDLLVRRADFAAAERSLERLGFEVTSRTSRGATMATTAWPLSLDLHHQLFPPLLFALPTDSVLNRAQLDATLFDTPILRLDDRDLLTHFLGHAVKSRMSPSDPCVVDDIAWLLQALDVDPKAYASHLRGAQMHRAAGYVLCSPGLARFPLARRLVEELDLGAADRAAIRAAFTRPEAYWAPHLLNGSLGRGVASLCGKAPDAMAWRVRRWRRRLARP